MWTLKNREKQQPKKQPNCKKKISQKTERKIEEKQSLLSWHQDMIRYLSEKDCWNGSSSWTFGIVPKPPVQRKLEDNVFNLLQY